MAKKASRSLGGDSPAAAVAAPSFVRIGGWLQADDGETVTLVQLSAVDAFQRLAKGGLYSVGARIKDAKFGAAVITLTRESKDRLEVSAWLKALFAVVAS